MDDSSFDRLTRWLATDLSRRRILQGVGLSFLGAFGVTRPHQASAQGLVEICHVTGNGESFRIQVASQALAGHLRHGDEQAAPLGAACAEIATPDGGFDCVAPDGLSACGADCVGASGAGDGRCGNAYLGCVPDGRPCSEFTVCCTDVCGSPSEPLIARCGACIGSGAGPCGTDADCCGTMTCHPGDFGGTCA